MPDARAQAFLKPAKRFFPFQRDDAQHMVYGPATSEAVDSFGTVFSLDATREALAEYEQWRTLRAMHDNIAAGTVPVLELDDQALNVGARVSDAAEWAKVTSGTYKGFSIGFDPLDGRYEMRDGTEVFVFTKYQLIEISLVDRPSNPDCTFTLYRKASDYLLADKAAGWTWDWKNDADAILAAGGQALLARACAWYDAGAADGDGDGLPDAKGDYKLPVARLAAEGDDTLTLYFYGVTAAMAALNGARKGVAIPDDQRQAVYDRLAAFYTLFDETPPEFNRRAQEDTMDEKQLEKSLERGIRTFFARLLGGKAIDGAGDQKADPPEPKATRLSVTAEARAALDAAVATLRALGTDEATKAAVEPAALAVQAVVDGSDVAAGTPPPDESEETRALKAQVEEQGRAIAALTEQLAAQASARKSQETVGGDPAAKKSRYGGAFFGH